jgi:glycosyltransferase involved in cell wall biosynthesis
MVRFVGWLSKEEMPLAYRSAHCMVAPSVNEGMSMAMNEALASGLYVFATDVSCNATLIRSDVNGALIHGKDAEMLAQQLAVFYRTRFLQDYRVPLDEVNRFHELYNWTAIARQYENILTQIVESSGSTL